MRRSARERRASAHQARASVATASNAATRATRSQTPLQGALRHHWRDGEVSAGLRLSRGRQYLDPFQDIGAGQFEESTSDRRPGRCIDQHIAAVVEGMID